MISTFHKTVLMDAILKTLTEANLPAFIGGSTRFNYSTANSDLDIFVYLPFGIPLSISEEAKESYFQDGEEDISYRYCVFFKLQELFPGEVWIHKEVDGYVLGKTSPALHYQGFGKAVDMVFFQSFEDFTSLRHEHDCVEKFLLNNKQLCTFVQSLKHQAPDLKGSFIYRGIKNFLS